MIWELDGRENRVLVTGDEEGGVWIDDGEFDVGERKEEKRVDEKGCLGSEDDESVQKELSRESEDDESMRKSTEGGMADEEQMGVGEENLESLEKELEGSLGDVKSIMNLLGEFKGQSGHEVDKSEEKNASDKLGDNSGDLHKEEKNLKEEEAQGDEKSSKGGEEEEKEEEVWSMLNTEMQETLQEVDRMRRKLRSVRGKGKEDKGKAEFRVSLAISSIIFLGVCLTALVVAGSWKQRNDYLYFSV